MTTVKNRSSIRCTGCGQQVAAEIYSYIDVTDEPQAKNMLISNRINRVQCPHCGTVNGVEAPLLYHDPTKELLIAYVPMELNLNKDQQERVIGDLMNRMPKDNFKGYMFSPRRSITMQGVIDQVLEADGITKEMMDDQRKQLEFVQSFLEVESEEALEKLVQENDDKIDEQFFQLMSMMAQRTMQEGRQDVAQQILGIQGRIVELSSYGQGLIEQQQNQQRVVEEVVQELESLPDSAGRDTFLQMAIEYLDRGEEYVQALVGLVRPAFDYDFFQMMTVKIDEAPADQKDKLEDLRQLMLELTAAIDQQQQAVVQQSAGFLQAVLTSPEPEAMLAENIELIDETFMAVLSANLQHAEQSKNLNAIAKLKEIYQMAVGVLQSQMPPEIRFVNDLLSTQDDETAQAMLNQYAPEFGDGLLSTMDAVHDAMLTRGNAPVAQRLKVLRAQAEKILS